MNRHLYPSDVSDEEWSFVAPSLTLMTEDAPQREHSLREVFNGLRFLVRTGAQWRMMPHDLPPWSIVYQQAQRWLKAGCFEAIVNDLCAVLRLAAGRNQEPSAAIFDSRTLQSTPESGHRAGYDGAKRRKGRKIHAAVDTLGNLLALHVTPANEQDRAQVGELVQAVQEVTGGTVELAYVDQGYTGDEPAQAASHGMRLEVVKLEDGQARVCPVAQAMGRGALVCMDDPFPPSGSRRRPLAGDIGRSSLVGFRCAHASSFCSFNDFYLISSQQTLEKIPAGFFPAGITTIHEYNKLLYEWFLVSIQ
jgi:transposase